MQRYLTAGVVGFCCVGFLLIFRFPEWRAFVDEFQTLITGTLAVFAAFFTVQQMQATDREAQSRHDELLENATSVEAAGAARHEQLVGLAVRRDKLMVERMLIPSQMYLQLERDSWPGFFIELPVFESVDSGNLISVSQLITLHREKLVKAADITRGSHWAEGAQLLDGFTTYHLSKMQSAIDKATASAYAIERYIVYPFQKSDDEMFDHLRRHNFAEAMKGKTPEQLRTLVDEFNGSVTTMIDEADLVLDCLVNIGSEYNIRPLI